MLALTETYEDSGTNIVEYAACVIDYISTCIESVVPNIKICEYPNQKPWINTEVRHMLRARSGNEEGCTLAKYRLRKSIKQAKRIPTLQLTPGKCGRT